MGMSELMDNTYPAPATMVDPYEAARLPEPVANANGVTIDSNVFREFAKRELADEKDEGIKEEFLNAATIARFHRIFKRVAKEANISYTVRFSDFPSMRTNALAEVTVGVNTADLPDGAIAAMFGHELGHVIAETQKKQMETLLSMTGARGHITSLSELSRRLLWLGFMGHKVASLFDPQEFYLKSEQEADKIGFKLALQAGFSKTEMLEALKSLGSDADKMRVAPLRKLIENFKGK